MSKETTHRCDLCKCVIQGKHATLTVPKPRKGKQGGEEVVPNYFASMFLISGSSDGDTRTYDVCVPCAVGLLRLTVAAHELRELEEV